MSLAAAIWPQEVLRRVTISLAHELEQSPTAPPGTAPSAVRDGSPSVGRPTRRGRRRARDGHFACVPTDTSAERSAAAGIGQAGSAETPTPRHSDDMLVDGPADELGGIDGPPDEIRCGDRWHARRGLWAFDTFNSNAWSSGLAHLKRTAADFVTLLGTRTRRGGDSKAAEDSARSNKWTLAVQPAVVTPANACSGGTAVGARSHVGMAPPSCPTPPGEEGPEARFSVQHIGAVLGGGLYLASTWLYPAVGARAKGKLDLLHRAAGVLRSLRGPWVISGDWNIPPADLVASGWLNLVGGGPGCAAVSDVPRRHLRLLCRSSLPCSCCPGGRPRP